MTSFAVPSAAPVGIAAKALGPSTVEVTWEPPPPQERNGVIIAYVITVFEQETGGVTDFVKNGSDSSIVVSHLHPYYNYRCSVSAATAIGTGPAAHAVVLTHERGN